MSMFNRYSKIKALLTLLFVGQLVAGSVLGLMPNFNVSQQASASGVTCNLTWGGRTEADGTGIRRIGAGSDWHIEVHNLQPGQQFRLANANLTRGGTTYNGFLTADSNGAFWLYDNTPIQGYEYAVGRYKTELQNTATTTVANCTPSFVIEDPNQPAVTPVPSSTPAPYLGPVVCRLDWTRGSVANGSQRFFNILVPTGTGIRRIGEGSNWSINVTGLQPSQSFRLANVNLTRGGITYNNFLNADTNGNFSLYDNTLIKSNEYSSGFYQTLIQNTSTQTITSCTPSFVIEDASTPTPTPVVNASGSISASPNPCNLGYGALCTSYISWSTSNSSRAKVYVTDDSSEKLFGDATSFSNDAAPWIKPGITYVFRLYDYSGGSRGAKLAEVAVTAIGSIATPTPYPTYTPYPTPYVGYNSATCTDINIPTTVRVGQGFNATVTMTNTGTKAWTKDNTPNRLGSQGPQDNMTWGLSRVDMNTSYVQPGQSANFNISAVAPSRAGTYNFNWRMVEEWQEWYGQTCTRQIKVVGNPVATPSHSPVIVYITSTPTPNIVCMVVGQTYLYDQNQYNQDQYNQNQNQVSQDTKDNSFWSFLGNIGTLGTGSGVIGAIILLLLIAFILYLLYRIFLAKSEYATRTA